MKIGTWNTKTLNNEEEEIIEEMIKYNIEILGISEAKKKGNKREAETDMDRQYREVWKRKRENVKRIG